MLLGKGWLKDILKHIMYSYLNKPKILSIFAKSKLYKYVISKIKYDTLCVRKAYTFPSPVEE